MFVVFIINFRFSCFNVLIERVVIWVCLVYWFYIIICLFRFEVLSFFGILKYLLVNDKDVFSLFYFEENDWYFILVGFGVVCNMINEIVDIFKKIEIIIKIMFIWNSKM